MTNIYKAISAVGEHYFGEGVTEHDLSPAEEQDALNAGHLELVPRKYKVLSDNYAAGAQGETVELALLKEQEGALLSGGHLERVEAADEPDNERSDEPVDEPDDEPDNE